MAQAYSFMGNQPKPKTQTQGQVGVAGTPTNLDKWNQFTPAPSQPPAQLPTSAYTGQQPSQGQSSGGWNLGQWNPQVPSGIGSGLANPGTPAVKTGQTWMDAVNNNGQLFNPGSFSEPNTPYARTLENSLPWAQFIQNSGQYRQDFDEAQRRWNQEQGWGQKTDQFNMGLAGRQQMSAEEQARLASDQWNRQFGQTQLTDQWGNEIARAQLGLQGQEIGNTGRYQQGLIGNQANLNASQAQYWQGQNANEAQANRNTAAYQTGLIGNQATLNQGQIGYWQGQNANEAIANQNTGQYQRGLVSNQAQEVANTGRYQTGLINVQNQANSIDQAYKSGLISNEQRNLALQELAQGQTYGIQQGTLAEQTRSARAAEALRQQEIAQQVQLANIAAYGRSQAPNARWNRSWS